MNDDLKNQMAKAVNLFCCLICLTGRIIQISTYIKRGNPIKSSKTKCKAFRLLVDILYKMRGI